MEISDRSGGGATVRFGSPGSVGVEKFLLFRGTGSAERRPSSDGAVGRPAAADRTVTVPYTVPHRAHGAYGEI